MKFFKLLHTYIWFYIGHFISKTFILNYGWGYDLYSKCMVKSSDLQDKYNLDRPWKIHKQ